MAFTQTAQCDQVGVLKTPGDRIVLHETFNQVPARNSVISGATLPTMNMDFEYSEAGTAVANTLDSNGGFNINTDSSDGARVVVRPHADTGQTIWATTQWLTNKEIAFNAHIVTGGSVADTIIAAGFKLTSTFVTATDANQAFFRLDDGVNSGRWQAVTSGTLMITNCTTSGDNAGDTGIAGAASTEYILTIVVDANRIARFFINHAFVYEAPCALTTTIALTPFIGVEADAAGTKAMRLISLTCSRDM